MQSTDLSKNIYHVGINTESLGLECNPYLLIDNDIAVLFDPGSVMDFDLVYKLVTDLVPLENIAYVVLHHEDPDFCSALPLFEQKGLKAKIVTSWRSRGLIQYYGLTSEYYLIEENHYQLSLPSGRKLSFIPTPYLHFAGAFATYDLYSKYLFSSDLFGAFSYNPSLFADDSYMQKMLAFHEHYMPSNDILRPVMEVFSRLDIRMILPQHGSIIKDNIPMYIEALKQLECGILIRPIRKHLLENGGIIEAFTEIFERVKALFLETDIMEVISTCNCIIIKDSKIVDYVGSPEEVWHTVFQNMFDQKGHSWLIALEPYVKQISYQFGLDMPKVFSTLLETVGEENAKLAKEKEHLESTIRVVNERLIKCPVTGLYNERFLKTLLLEELETEDWRDIGAEICIDIDDFGRYKQIHGLLQSSDAIKSLIYLIGEVFDPASIFKLDQADFGIYARGFSRDEILTKLDEVRVLVSQSDSFLSPLTLTIGVAFSNELLLDAPSYDTVVDDYIKKAHDRMRIGKKSGKNVVISEGLFIETKTIKNKLLIVDPDETNLEILEVFAHEMHFTVFRAQDGITALNIIQTELPSLIVSEVSLPRLDGLLLREKMLESSKTKDIPMILLSHQKDEAHVSRAQQLGIAHYFKKPYMLYELMGIIKYYLKG